MNVNWNGYVPYSPVHGGIAGWDLTRKQARERYDQIMNARDARVVELSKLLAANGIELRYDDSSIQELDDWFQANVEWGTDAREMSEFWSAVAFDIALFLGEVMIQRKPTLRWEMPATGRKKTVGYHKHVITGFTKSKDPSYWVDLDGRVEIDAYRALSGDRDMPNFLVRTLSMELELA